MRLARVLAAAAIAGGAFAVATPAQAGPYCDQFPEQCDYDCVMAPCTPDDVVPFVWEKVFGGSAS